MIPDISCLHPQIQEEYHQKINSNFFLYLREFKNSDSIKTYFKQKNKSLENVNEKIITRTLTNNKKYSRSITNTPEKHVIPHVKSKKSITITNQSYISNNSKNSFNNIADSSFSKTKNTLKSTSTPKLNKSLSKKSESSFSKEKDLNKSQIPNIKVIKSLERFVKPDRITEIESKIENGLSEVKKIFIPKKIEKIKPIEVKTKTTELKSNKILTIKHKIDIKSLIKKYKNLNQ